MPLSTELMSKYLVWRPSGKWRCCFSNNPSLLKQIHWFPLERQTASTLELWYYIFEFKSVGNNGSFAPLHIHTHTLIKRILRAWNSENQFAPKLSELWWTVELADQGSFVTAVTLSISSSSIQGLSSVVVATPMITLLF